MAGSICMVLISGISTSGIKNGEVMASLIDSRATAKEPFEAVLIESQTFINALTCLSENPFTSFGRAACPPLS